MTDGSQAGIPMEPNLIPEDELSARVLKIKSFFLQLNKSMKQISLYRHNVSGYGEYIRLAYDELNALLEEMETLSLMVEQRGLKYQGVQVYGDDSNELNLAYRFYRDGIRLLRFRAGLDEKELLHFILVCLTNFKETEFANEDMVSLMWRSDFKHIEHVVMETFALGQESAEQTQIDVDNIVGFLYRTMSSASKDRVQFARLSLDDLDIEIRDVEQIAGIKIEGESATEGDRERFRKEVTNDLAVGNFRRLCVVLFAMFESDLDVKLSEVIQEAFEQLLDTFLLQENLEAIRWLFDQFNDLKKKNIPPGSMALVDFLSKHLVSRLSDSERVDKIGDMLEADSRPEMIKRVQSHFEFIDERALDSLLGVLERLSNPATRQLVCNKLASFGPQHVDVYVNRLSSSKANYVRDMLHIIDLLGYEDRTKVTAGLLNHPNLAIRIEALKTIGDGQDPSAGPYVMRALKDPDPQVRITAAMLLPNFDRAMALRSLLSLAKDPSFDQKSEKEQAAVYGSMSSLGMRESMEFLKEQMHSGGILSKKSSSNRKRNIVNGIVACSSISGYQLLKAELAAGIKDKELANLVQRACVQLKKRLLGSAGE